MTAASRAVNLRADLRREVEKTIRSEYKRKVTDSDLLEIGRLVIARMQRLIASGQSPVAGFGRFPEYKSRSNARELRRQARAAGSAARSAGNAAQSKKLRATAKSLRSKAGKAQKKGYPDSLGEKALRKFGKKARPVNLKLSGAFLKDLEVQVRNRIIEIGYFDKLSAKKELGHREGANGQAVRPTIPLKSEKFNAVIDVEILRAIDRVLKRRL